ncbi:hypothetical protein BKA93DRAFT_752940 [Sparassis latifolia]
MEVPKNNEDWSTPASIVVFQSRVHEWLMQFYRDINSGKITLMRKLARVLFMILEHEAFHAEHAGTGTLPPTGFSPPVWSTLTSGWDHNLLLAISTVTLGPATVMLGHGDDKSEDACTSVHAFGWDNEHPKGEVHIGEFKIEWQPITNGEFYEYYSSKGKEAVKFPASWVEVEGEVQPELRLFMDMFDCAYKGGANIGFRNWHPVPATAGRDKDARKGHNGGIWEWTSTSLDEVDLPKSRLSMSKSRWTYADSRCSYLTSNVDVHRHIVLGSSYTTVPRLEDR